ncbi:MAG TPA: lysylphosphatidylglycerol synthase transmembrane domain-containing protein [Leadbetterella sp.]|nr:lysylphosphatidylglycerol synthase transmembrane domain-containing protein [Leadbetterella sp.]
MKKALKYILPIALGLALLNWVFKDIDLLKTLQSFRDANYVLVFFAAILALLAHISRAARWNIMLEPLGYKPSLRNTSIAVLIGYLTNLVFPRAGELARSASLQKSENVPFDKSFGAVIAERIIDVLILGLLVLVNLLLEFGRIKSLFIDLFGGQNPTKLLFVLGGLLLLGVLGIVIFQKNKEKFLRIGLVKKIFDFTEGLRSGFLSVLKIEKSAQFFLHTFFIWAMYYVSTYLLCKAVSLGDSLGFLSVLTILVMGSIGMAVPTIGGIGSYHLLVGKIVALYGLSNQDGISLATFLHTMTGILFILIFGLIAFIMSFLSTKKANVS